MTDGALNGLRVLDLSDRPGGGYCAKLLAMYGATVTKIERPGAGSRARSEGPFAGRVPSHEASAEQLYLDSGKRSVTLDVDSGDGAALLRRLAASTDVLIEDAGHVSMERRGLSHEELASNNRGLIYVSVTPFGSSGPYAEFEATQLTLYALGGYMALTGDSDREPLQGPGAQPAYLAGMYAFAGVMAALWARADGRGGQYVEVSELEAVAASHQWTISRYNYSGKVQRRIGNRYDSGHPITIYPSADGYVAIGISTDDQAERFFVLIGRPELMADPRFGTNLARLEHADELDEIIGPWFLARSSDEIAALCQEMRVPAARASTVADLLDDPHLAARGFWREVERPDAGALRYPGPPFHLPAAPGSVRPAPLLGDDNGRVLVDELGVPPDELTRLRQIGAI